MRNLHKFFIIAVLLFFVLQPLFPQSGPLHGTYTIGSGGNYPSVKAAVDSLKSNGISGPVIFNIKDGTYNEQISITAITGSSAINTITFQSESNDSTKVILSYSASYSYNYTLQLSGVSYITFNKISITALNNSNGRVIDIRNGSHHNTFRNCVLQGIAASSTYTPLAIIYSDAYNDRYNTFTSNRILNGSYGFYYYGTSGTFEKGTSIRNNSFENQYYRAINLTFQDSLSIQNNSFTTNSSNTTFTGIWISYNSNQLNINKNKIHVPNGGHGIYLTYCNRNSSVSGLVANNFVTVGGSGIVNAYGIYLSYSEYQKIYNNSINILGTSAANGRALFIDASSSGSVNIENNILVNNGGGYCYYVNSTSIINISDYNDYYTTGQNIAYWSGDITDISGLRSANTKDAHSVSCSPLFLSNTDLRPHEIWLNGSGNPLPEITDDIDGEARNATHPDIGADEFTPLMTDVGIYALNSPEMPFNTGSRDIIITVKNHGAETINSVAIDWSVNSIMQTREDWTGTLNSGDTVHVNLGNYNFNPGTPYSIRIWTSSPNGHADLNTSNDTIHKTNLYTALTGTYTVGGTGPDFLNFQSAITALIQGGITGNVIFKIRNGTYDEQLVIPEIIGASEGKTIAFESESGDSTGVILRYSANYSSNYTIQMNGADYIRFNKITISSLNTSYGRVVHIGDSSSNNIFSSCILQGSGTNSEIVYLNGKINRLNEFKNSRIINGSYGIYCFNTLANLGKRIVIEDNIFENQSAIGISMIYQDSIIIRNNIINTDRGSLANFKDISLTNCTNDFLIEKNKLYAPDGGYGISLSNGTSVPLTPGLIANNFIQIGGTSTAQGIYITFTGYVRIYNNNIHISSTASTNAAAAIYSNNGSYIDIQNNILANSEGGYVFNILHPTGITVSDFNDIYTSGPNVAFWQGITNVPTLHDLQVISSKDAHSISENPYFYSVTDLHVRQIALNRSGNPLSLIPTDIDGDIRDALSPDIGADEFSPISSDAGVLAITEPEAPFPQGVNDVSVIIRNHGADALTSVTIKWSVNNIHQPDLNWNGSLPSADTIQVKLGTFNFEPLTGYIITSWTILPNGLTDLNTFNDTAQLSEVFTALSGTYTIGGTSPDFGNFQDAVDGLILSGIIGDVTFKVRGDTYNEQISIPEIKGAGINSTVLFEPESGDSTDVILTYSADYTNNYTLQLDGADYIWFNKLVIEATSNYYGNVIIIKNGANQNIFSRCTLKGMEQISRVISSDGSNDENNRFTNNVIMNGEYGIYFWGISYSDLEKGNVFENNYFLNQDEKATYFYYQDSLVFRKNYVNTNSTYNGFYCIYCYSCTTPLIIEKNKVYAPNGSHGIYIYSTDGTSLSQGLIANNFVQVGGTGSAYGIYLYSSDYHRVYNNNINVTSTSASNNYAMNCYSSQNIYLVNNAIVNSGGGYALYTSSPTALVVSDYNDLYTTGTNLAYWSGNRANLSLLQSASGKDLHSISVDPQFFSDTDLHVKEVTLDNTGTPLVIITEDIDDEPRSTTHPDIGADEFNPSPVDAGVSAIAGPQIPFSEGNNNVIVSIKNFGSDTITTVLIDWKINDNPQSQYNWSGALIPGDTSLVNLGIFNFIPSTEYTITCWTSMPNGIPDLSNSNDTVHLSNLITGLQGTYFIGGTSPDFQNFTEAITSLFQRGVTSPVIFKVRNGTYNEQLSISKVPGTTENNTISFESESGDSSEVILSYSASYTFNYTVQLDGAEYIKFSKMTIQATNIYNGNVVDIKNSSRYNAFSQCILITPSGTSTIINSIETGNNDFNSFINNKITGGQTGIYFTQANKGTLIGNNIFENQGSAAIQFNNQDSLIVMKNTITTNSTNTGYHGVYCGNCYDNLRIEKNRIYASSGGHGISLMSFGSYQGLIANNFIQIGGNQAAYGIYCAMVNAIMIYNNNIHITTTHTNSSALYITNNTSENKNIDVRNNIFFNAGNGYAIYNYYNNSVSISDYNDIYTNGTYLAYWAGNRTTLSDLRSASNKDSHSISVDPGYISTTDLHVTEISLKGAGIHLNVINDDIDGDLRNIPPDIGADEFVVAASDDAGIISITGPKMPFVSGNNDVYAILKNYGSAILTDAIIKWKVNNNTQPDFNWNGSLSPAGTDTIKIGSYNFLPLTGYSITVWPESPNGVPDINNDNDTSVVNNLYTSLTGSFTIGGPGPDFETPAEAVNIITHAGIAGPVTFNIRPGTYKSRIEISSIYGSSASNRVIFRAENGDSTSVILMDSINTAVISLNGAEYITFTNLTIKNTYPNYGKVIELVNSSSYNQFLNNIIESGSFGIDLRGINDTHPQTGNSIENNSFFNQNTYAVHSIYQENLRISNNTIQTNSNFVSVYGIYLNNCKESLTITKNKISVVNDGYGIYLNGYTGNSTNQGFIANNFISTGGSSAETYCMYSGNNVFLNFYNNTINNKNTLPASIAFYYQGGVNNSIVNNILSNTGGGIVLSIGNLSSIKTSDYNDLFTTGENLVTYNNTLYKNLASWKLVSNLESHSVSVDPIFYSDSDLHVSQIALDSAGLSLPLITDDIDGDPRDLQFPDIGADEFANTTHDLAITSVLPASGCMLGSNESIIITIKNSGAYPESGFNVAYSIDTLPSVIENITTVIPAGGSLKYTFNKKANLSRINIYLLRTYLDLTSDDNPINDTLVTSVSNMPKFDMGLTRDTVICPGTFVQLTATGASTYIWNTGSTWNYINVYPSYTTSYIVRGTNLFNCIDIDTVTIQVYPFPHTPIITASGPTTFCNDGSVVLTSSVVDNITWSTHQKTPSITVYNSGLYYVTQTDSNGCSSVSEIINITEEPAPVIEPDDTTICLSSPVQLTVINAVSYIWSNGAISQSIDVSPSVTTTYSVNATTAMGCKSTVNSTIHVLPSLTPGLVSGMIPADGSDGLSLPLEVSWMPADNANYYDLFIWPENQVKPDDPFVSNVTGIRFEMDTNHFDFGQTYNWQIISKYYGCASTPGPVQTFNVRHLPDLVVENVQIPGSAFTGQEIEITWDIKNQGLGNTANQTWEDHISLSLDTIVDDFYTLGYINNMTYLEPGQIYSKKAPFILPTDKDGLFNVLIWSNRKETLLENRYNNNQGRSINPIWVKLTPPPDLFVSAIFSPSDFFSEDTLHVTWTVINNGTWPTPNKKWFDKVSISQDYNVSRRFELGNFTYSGGILEPGESYTNTQLVIIPEGIFGKYYFYIETDAGNYIQEHAWDGNNLTQSDSLNVILRPPADLKVSEIIIPKIVTNLGPLDIQWTVTNIGNSSPRDNEWIDRVYLSLSPVFNPDSSYFFAFKRTHYKGIPAKYEYQCTENIKIPVDISPGDYYVYVHTDYNDRVFEYIYNDNNLLRSDTTVKITIAPWSDLIVTKISHPESAGAYEIIPVSYTVSNKGTAKAKGGWTDCIYVSYNDSEPQLLKEIKRYDGLEIDSSYTINLDIKLPAGFSYGSNNYQFNVTTDTSHSVYEHIDDNNNTLTDIIFIKPSDLGVQTTNIPATIYSGTLLNISWSVVNSGTSSPPALYWEDKVYILDSLNIIIQSFSAKRSGPVIAGSSYTYQNTFELPDGIFGNYSIVMLIDEGNKNRESITTNNIKSVPIKIELRPPSDLIVNSLTHPASGTAGQPITINWQVKNAGPGSTLATEWNDQLFLSSDTILHPLWDIPLGTFFRTGALTSGETYNYSAEVFLPINTIGNYYVIAKTDYVAPVIFQNLPAYGHEYEYQAENNNTALSLLTINLAPPSDLIVTNITVPANAVTGESLTIEWTIKNLGPNNATGYLTDMIYFSEDVNWDISDKLFGINPIIIDLSPSEDTILSLTTELTGTTVGNYYVIVRTDNKNNIYEVNDLNNTLSSSSQVNVEVPLLNLNVSENKTLINNKGLYYRIEIPDSLIDETLLISLTGDTVAGVNELFISYDRVPDRSDYEFTSIYPFYGNQEAMVPSLKKGTYYLLVFGNTLAGDQQDIGILARIIDFQIRSVKANTGGNRGTVTAEMYGARFTPNMQVKLHNPSLDIPADSIIFVDATKVFVTFNLKDAPLDFYDIIAIDEKEDTAILQNGFEVVEKSPFGLVTYVKTPGSIVLGTSATVAVQYANDGNIDIPVPVFKLISEDELPIAFHKVDLDKKQYELEFEFREVNGPPHILRPGAAGAVHIWVNGTKAGVAHFRFE